MIEIEGGRKKVCVREREREVACAATLLSLFIEIDKGDKILVSRKNFRKNIIATMTTTTATTPLPPLIASV